MSVYYSGKKCSVCNITFSDSDDVVVCPVCGAPHHRECWSGQCAYHDKHGTDQQWQDTTETTEDSFTEEKENTQSQNGKAVTCMRCGRINFPAGDKCIYCGNPLSSNNFDPLGETANRFPFMMDPLGGVDPYEDIGGATAGETAEFVVVNTQRYVPKFSRMKKTKQRVSWNWAAFLLPGYWFLYRKCYIQGIFVLLLTIITDILSTPFTQRVMGIMSAFDNYQDVINYLSNNMDVIPLWEYMLCLLSMGILLAIMIICGMFGDIIYKKHCINKLKDLKKGAKSGDKAIPGAILKAKKGGISFFAPIVGYFCYELVILLLLQFM